MHCSGCGTELEAGLNYCKRCGKRVKEEKSVVGQGLVNALGAIGVFGVIGFVIALYLMLRSPTIAPVTIMMVSVLYLATLFAILFLILRQTAQLTSGRLPNGGRRPDMPVYVESSATAQLSEATQEPISVSEHTTRDLAESPLIRK